MPSAPMPEARRGHGLVVLEPDAEGHAEEWLRHLVDFTVGHPDDGPLWLVVPPALSRSLSSSLPAASSGRVRLIALHAREQRYCLDRRLVVSAFARWFTMRRHLHRTGARAGFFLSLDHLSLPLALGLGARGKKLSGILFRPSVHYREIGPYRPTWRERLRDWRKDVLYRLMLRNGALASVLSLDPFFVGHAGARYRGGDKVRALPDPTHPPPPARPRVAVDFPPPGRIGFLMFGYLTERKGPLRLLDALTLLPPEIAARTAVLLAGRVDPALRDLLEQRRRSVAAARPDLWLRLDDRRLSASELTERIRRSDVVLAPYLRFVGSSGVLLWAAREGRPVLAQDYGLVGRLTREHGLGAVTDTDDPSSLARQIACMVERGPASFIDRSSAQAYADSHAPHDFAAIVMAAA